MTTCLEQSLNMKYSRGKPDSMGKHRMENHSDIQKFVSPGQEENMKISARAKRLL